MTQPDENRALLSVLIPVKNDAANLRECLRTVSFADEIVVVDSASTDDTEKVTRDAGGRMVQFEWNGMFPRKKNWALANISWRNEWVLIIDADERITPKLEIQILDGIERKEVDGFYLNRRFWFLDGWINHSGYFPSWNLRLFRHRKGRYERFETAVRADSGDNEVHEHLLLDGRVEYLSEPMEHYAFPDIATFVEKHNRYSTWEAQVREQWRSESGRKLKGNIFGSPLERKRWWKHMTLGIPCRPTLRFLYHFIFKQGFRDGYRGWVLSRLMAWYEFLICVKAREGAAHDLPRS
jgi:glycosyltransferase involved in cell wall biosynthesis